MTKEIQNQINGETERNDVWFPEDSNCLKNQTDRHTYVITYLLTYILKYLLTYVLTQCSRVLLEKLTVSQLVKKFPAFYGTRTFITAFTSARLLSLSRASQVQLMPHPSHFLKIHFNIFSPSTPWSSKWSISLRFPQNNPACNSPLTPYVLQAPPNSFQIIHQNNIV